MGLKQGVDEMQEHAVLETVVGLPAGLLAGLLIGLLVPFINDYCLLLMAFYIYCSRFLVSCSLFAAYRFNTCSSKLDAYTQSVLASKRPRALRFKHPQAQMSTPWLP